MIKKETLVESELSPGNNTDGTTYIGANSIVRRMLPLEGLVNRQDFHRK